jgi:hypothetical protein
VHVADGDVAGDKTAERNCPSLQPHTTTASSGVAVKTLDRIVTDGGNDKVTRNSAARFAAS